MMRNFKDITNIFAELMMIQNKDILWLAKKHLRL